GIVGAAAIDVFVNEPPTGSSLLELDNIITTPHLGASTEEAQVNVAVDVANEIVNALKGENVSTALNMPSIRSDVMVALVPYMQLAETIGHLASQLMVGSYDTVKVEYCGELAEKDVKPITVAVIKGLLDTIMGSAVNYVNAQMLAKERKIEIIESKSSSSSCYQNSLSLTLIKGDTTKTVAGTVIGDELRIIKIDSYQVDIKPAGSMVISRHLNKPNIIGPCCLALGEKNINIAGMQVSPSGIGDEAIMAINVDSDIPEDVMDSIRNIDGIIDATIVKL
ncbi:MAG: phosphoglycerate dehydrogenase, partial [Methanosarcinales archaeon]|nr:phosphoglycerate dehydrogenase [Methanosarcinales archaeon]